MKKLHKVGKFYTRIIMNNIGIFIFIGILSVIFNDHGWFPDKDMYAISQLVYKVILPSFIAYEGGRAVSGREGGIAGVLAVAGVIWSGSSAELFGAMLLGPAAGYLWKRETSWIEEKFPSSMQMLGKNLIIGITGGLFSAAGIYLILPLLEWILTWLFSGISFLARYNMTACLSIFIEPAKVFFLNNVVNHMLLVPVGMEQIQKTGSTVLFLLETNPGPGIGVILALFYMKRINKNETASVLTAHALGGIHEVYFPLILSNLWLLPAVIVGGLAGNITFQISNAAVKGVVSPGSIFTILIMADSGCRWKVLAGILISSAASFLSGVLFLKKSFVYQKKHPFQKIPPFQKKETDKKQKDELQQEHIQEKSMEESVKKIAFVCDGGIGSSVMGAALLRRKLQSMGKAEITVEAFAADLVPEDIDVVICQKDFYSLHGDSLKNRRIYLVDSLLQTEECMILFQKNEGGEAEK